MDDTKREVILDLLRTAYCMEMETVMNYVAASINLDGFRAKHVRDTLDEDVAEELVHARQLGQRIKVLGGTVPTSFDVETSQSGMQIRDSLDVEGIVDGVIEAEEAAIAHYQKLIEESRDVDPVTEDLCVQLKGDEEGHRRLFLGFRAELQRSLAGAT